VNAVLLLNKAWETCWAITLGSATFHLLIAAALHERDCEIRHNQVRRFLQEAGLFTGLGS